MSLIRKAFWPTAIALGFLVFLAALSTLRVANAQDISVLEVCGPKKIQQDSTHLYVAIVDDPEEQKTEAYFIDLDDIMGDSDIRSRLQWDGDDWFYDEISATDFLTKVHDLDGDELQTNDTIEDVVSQIELIYGVDLFDIFLAGDCAGYMGLPSEEDLADRILDAILDCMSDGACSAANGFGVADAPDLADIAAKAAELLLGYDEPGLEWLLECDIGPFTDDLRGFLLLNLADDFTVTLATAMADAFCSEVLDFFAGDMSLVVVDVNCEDRGEFELSIWPESGSGLGSQIAVQCVGETGTGIILEAGTATPTATTVPEATATPVVQIPPTLVPLVPTVAPIAGNGGISPPSTGDGGLADSR